jgi:hypothetical protein
VGTPHNATGAFPGKEVGGVQVLAGLAPSSHVVGSLLRAPLAGEVGQKNLANSELSKFTSMEKYIQLLLIKCIWQSKKFDQVGF